MLVPSAHLRATINTEGKFIRRLTRIDVREVPLRGVTVRVRSRKYGEFTWDGSRDRDHEQKRCEEIAEAMLGASLDARPSRPDGVQTDGG